MKKYILRFMYGNGLYLLKMVGKSFFLAKKCFKGHFCAGTGRFWVKNFFSCFQREMACIDSKWSDNHFFEKKCHFSLGKARFYLEFSVSEPEILLVSINVAFCYGIYHI